MSEDKQELPLVKSLAHFLFEIPLYSAHSLGADLARVSELYGRKKTMVDGHCPYCGREATFNVNAAHIPAGDPWNNIKTYADFDQMSIRCTRNENHGLHYWFLINKMVIQKIGQYPSLADIANDEVKVYRKLLAPDMASEFHKAVGLAAHGVGVGSFVYLRRVFEALIKRRFDEFKDREGWDPAQFKQARMEDKIALLEGHLPEFLVANRKIYSFSVLVFTS